MSDNDATALAGLFLLSNILTYFFSRREVFNKGFEEGWNRCTTFMAKEVMKRDPADRL